MIVTRSAADFRGTIEALCEAIARRGLTMFARIDHAGAARRVGLELAEEEVILFGNPQAGTPLMRSDPRIGIELPLRMLVWADAAGVSLGYRDPRQLTAGYDVAQHESTLSQMAALLSKLADEAAGRSA
jgi:uncharacterized protein (DUF302 family)